ncbi:transporter [Streptomyces sp. Act143]|uniref:copper resistance CopC/CopD family protein n=1 Tax=Streptomyces sp. Act143 TaxID=2200760 RepID=UPI000D6740B1|nr:copper resistance protein CopC [Streptomyces sp. Act143]PWI16552.1 transporter [Streptomyces sp. Act143]
MLLGTVLVLLLFGGTGPASAHAALRAVDPEDGSVLKSAPRHLTLTFTESVGLLDDSFRVLDPDNRRVRTGEAEHVPGRSDTARVTLPAQGLGEGTFTVAWRVVSADSHPVSGAFTFSVGKPSATTASVDPGPVEDPATAALYDIARYLAHLAAALLIGTAVFLAACRPAATGDLPRLLWAGWWTLAAASTAQLLLRASYETGTAPALDGLDRTLTTRPGLVLLARLGLLALTGLYLRWVRKAWSARGTRVAGGALAVALALTWAAGEHASAGLQVPVAMASSVLHVLAMATWLGGLTALVTTLYRAPVVEAATVARFSRLAFACVTVLVVTGVYQSWRGLGSWAALTGTSYGRLLLFKLTAVIVLLGAAGLSRQWTARLVTAGAENAAREPERVPVPVPVGGPPSPPAAERAGAADDGGYRRGLRRSVAVEITVGVVVLVLTTVLTGTLPGRAAEAAAETAPAGGLPVASVTNVPFDLGAAGRGTVQITLDPGRVGRNSVQAIVYGADGGFATVPELRLTFTLASQDIGPLDARLTDRGGYWGTSDFDLPIAGTWTMRTTVRISETDQVSETDSIEIR